MSRGTELTDAGARAAFAAYFAKVDRAVLIAAGAPFTDILLTSQQSAVIEQRTKRMAGFSFSPAPALVLQA